MFDNVTVEKGSESMLEPHTNVSNLKELCHKGYDNACAYEKQKSECSPDDTVNFAVYTFYGCQNCVHFKMNLLKNISTEHHQKNYRCPCG